MLALIFYKKFILYIKIRPRLRQKKKARKKNILTKKTPAPKAY